MHLLHLTHCTSLTAPHSLHLTHCASLSAPHSVRLTQCTSLSAPHSVRLTQCASLSASHSVRLTQCASLSASTLHLTQCTSLSATALQCNTSAGYTTAAPCITIAPLQHLMCVGGDCLNCTESDLVWQCCGGGASQQHHSPTLHHYSTPAPHVWWALRGSERRSLSLSQLCLSFSLPCSPPSELYRI